MITKTAITIAVIFLLSLEAHAQKPGLELPYKTAIGLRATPFGISFKTNSSIHRTSFEIIGYFVEGFTASGLYYWNFTLDKKSTLRFYLGGGGQAGFKDEDHGGGAVLGLGGIIGFDYKFLKLPINISADWQPSYQFGSNDEFQGKWGGIAARFAF